MAWSRLKARLVSTLLAFPVAACCVCVAGRGFAQAIPHPSREPYHIGVWYFTVWNSAANSIQVQKTQQVYGRDDVWGGVRDYAAGHGIAPVEDPKTHAPVDFSNREPLLGFYDLMQQSDVDAEIEEAASEGIEFFAFYWYLDVAGHETGASAPVGKFFSSKLAGRMRYVLAPIVNRRAIEPALSLQAWNTNIVPQILGYMASPAYDRIGGRPMLIDFRLPFADPETYAAAYASLRQAVLQRFGVEPLIINLLGAKATFAHMQFRQSKLRPDGFTCFSFPVEGAPQQPYADYAQEFIDGIRRQAGLGPGERKPSLVYIPCGSIGQDARPWYRIEYGWNPGNGLPGPDSRSYTTRPTPAEFRDNLEELKGFIDSGDLDTMNTAILYAWNEWGEAAAAIEPSKTEGYRYADAVRDVFGLVPRGKGPARPAR